MIEERKIMSKSLTHKEICRKGGLTTFERYGKKFMSDNGKKGVKAQRKKYGPDHFLKLAKMGLAARLKKYELRKRGNDG